MYPHHVDLSFGPWFWVQVGLANIFVQHTSASLTINENASPDVPLDLNDDLDRIVPESGRYRHLDEGPDDMPAHTKVCTACVMHGAPLHGPTLLLAW